MVSHVILATSLPSLAMSILYNTCMVTADTIPRDRHYGVRELLDGVESSALAQLAAARRSLELRGDSGTGWSIAWKIKSTDHRSCA